MGCAPLYRTGESRASRNRGGLSWSQLSPLVTWTCFPQPQPHPIPLVPIHRALLLCSARPDEQFPRLGRGQRDFGGVSCTEFAAAGLMGCPEASLPTASSIFITMIALHSQKIGLPGFSTLNRYSVWLCVILTRQIIHILQAGGTLILILSNFGFCLLTSYHFLL